MTVSLVRWFTQHNVCGGLALVASGAKPRFDRKQVRRFDKRLRGAWPNKYVPMGIRLELAREAAGLCSLCSQPCDRLQAAHIERKKVELAHHCQHPSNLIMLDPTCHDRYDADLIPLAAVRHAKERVQSRLMEQVDRDIVAAREIRKAIRKAIKNGDTFLASATRVASMVARRDVTATSYVGAITGLMTVAHEVGENWPLSGGTAMGLAFRGQLSDDIDAFGCIDSLAEPLPTRHEFERELDGYRHHREEHDPSPQLVAWAAGAKSAYECGVCGEICVEPDGLTDALVEHWREEASNSDDDDDDVEPFDEDKVRSETHSAIVNSGVECGDIWGEGGLCSYHANQAAKDD